MATAVRQQQPPHQQPRTQTQTKAATKPNEPQPYVTRWEREKAKAKADGQDIEGGDPASIGPWILGEMLGRGASGRVRLARHFRSGKLAAVKILQLHPSLSSRSSALANAGDKAEKMVMTAEREIAVMKLLDHPNIMSMYDVWSSPKELYLVLEYVEGGELFDYLCSRGSRLPLLEAVSIIKQVLAGVDYCHRFNICHRDLKPENILLSDEVVPLSNPPQKVKVVKIADFGMSTLDTLNGLLRTSCGSPHYASPEIVKGQNYSGALSDIWSCGVIFFALCTSRLPFDDPNVNAVLKKVRDGRFTMPDWVAAPAKDLIHRMLEVDITKRITMSEIFAHPLMQLETPGITIPIVPKINDIALPVERIDIDSDLLRNLCIIWREKNKPAMIERLCSKEKNFEKAFYYLLCRYRDRSFEDYNMDTPFASSAQGTPMPSPLPTPPPTNCSGLFGSDPNRFPEKSPVQRHFPGRVSPRVTGTGFKIEGVDGFFPSPKNLGGNLKKVQSPPPSPKKAAHGRERSNTNRSSIRGGGPVAARDAPPTPTKSALRGSRMANTTRESPVTKSSVHEPASKGRVTPDSLSKASAQPQTPIKNHNGGVVKATVVYHRRANSASAAVPGGTSTVPKGFDNSSLARPHASVRRPNNRASNIVAAEKMGPPPAPASRLGTVVEKDDRPTSTISPKAVLKPVSTTNAPSASLNKRSSTNQSDQAYKSPTSRNHTRRSALVSERERVQAKLLADQRMMDQLLESKRVECASFPLRSEAKNDAPYLTEASGNPRSPRSKVEENWEKVEMDHAKGASPIVSKRDDSPKEKKRPPPLDLISPRQAFGGTSPIVTTPSPTSSAAPMDMPSPSAQPQNRFSSPRFSPFLGFGGIGQQPQHQQGPNQRPQDPSGTKASPALSFMSPLPSVTAGTGNGTTKGLFARMFDWKSPNLLLWSTENIVVTRAEACRILKDIGVIVAPCENGGLKCRVDEIIDSVGNIYNKTVRFRVDFAPVTPETPVSSMALLPPNSPGTVPPQQSGSGSSGSELKRCPTRGGPPPNVPTNCTVTFIQERGAYSVLKVVHARVKEIWSLDRSIGGKSGQLVGATSPGLRPTSFGGRE